MKIALFLADTSQAHKAQALAAQLQLPIVVDDHAYSIILAVTKQRLELRFPQDNLKPIFIDFLANTLRKRLGKSHRQSELIARAVGMKGSQKPTILDATAGFGIDASILAYLGCSVQMVERSPIMCVLLEDGLQRAGSSLPWLERLTLTCQNSQAYLQQAIDNQCFFDVVYLDPMFPERQKSALVRKEMQVLQQLVGFDEDADDLLPLARKVAKKRVVVKRPRLAPVLAQQLPTIVYKAKVCRFDVYLM